MTKTNLKTFTIAGLTALTLGATVAATTPASAQRFHGGGWHGGYGRGAGLGLGLAAGALATGAAYDYYHRPYGYEGYYERPYGYDRYGY